MTKPSVVIVGAGGHAKVIIEILEEQGTVEIVGTVSRNVEDVSLLGYPSLGDDGILPKLLSDGVRHAFVAVGENSVRKRISESLSAMGFSLVNALHPQAVISRRVVLGIGIAVMAGAVVQSNSVIGNGVIVNTGTTVDHDCVIGSFAHLAPGVNLAGGVQISEGVFAGVGAKLIPGICVGAWSVLGAGAVVIRNVPERVTVTGVPATIRE